MNRDEYLQSALSTWTTDWSRPQQIAHAAGTLIDEWFELRDAIENADGDDWRDRIADELGDVYYGLAILQHTVGGGLQLYLPGDGRLPYGESHGIRECQRLIVDLHGDAIKVWRSEALDYYDLDDVLSDMQDTRQLSLAEYLGGIAVHYDLSVDDVLAQNRDKLSVRHD